MNTKAYIIELSDPVYKLCSFEIVKINTKTYIIELSEEYSIVTQFTSFVPFR